MLFGVTLQKLQDSSLVARIPQLRYVRFNKGYSFIPVSQNNFIKSSFSMNYDVRFIHSLWPPPKLHSSNDSYAIMACFPWFYIQYDIILHELNTDTIWSKFHILKNYFSDHVSDYQSFSMNTDDQFLVI